MTIEDSLDRSENRDGELDELLGRVARLMWVNTDSSSAAVKAQLRFQQSLHMVRDLDEEMHLARCDLFCARMRMLDLILMRGFRVGPWYHSVWFSWTETRNSFNTYRLFARRAYRAMRAALVLIFLRTR
jgi:hypothetical protein